MRHPDALTIVARCANPSDPDTMLDALRLLAAVCLVKDGCAPLPPPSPSASLSHSLSRPLVQCASSVKLIGLRLSRCFVWWRLLHLETSNLYLLLIMARTQGQVIIMDQLFIT